MNVSTALVKAKSVLRQANIHSWSLDAELLMAYATNLTREKLITHDKYILNKNEEYNFSEYIKRRINMEPVQYIIRKSEFMGLELYVDKNVLIPRPDTECMTELAIEYITKNNVKSVLDMCCGSGAIGISVAYYCPNTNVVFSDISKHALEITQKNASNHNIYDRAGFVESDLFTKLDKSFDVIISNPPYISQTEMNNLPRNVKNFEPYSALFGGRDGLSFYYLIAENLSQFLNNKGKIFLEIGSKQKRDVINIFQNKNCSLYREIKDLAGLDRALIFSKNIQ